MSANVSFKNPPVVETVLGVQFDRVKGLSNGHMGAFWATLGPDWPSATDAPRLDDESERFGTPFSWGGMGLRIGPQAASRLQIWNTARDRMIQAQDSRILYNWLGTPEGAYPRYRTVRPEFDAILRRFQEFVEGRGIGTLSPNQWEVTYVNQMPKGTVWESPSDWAEVFRGLPGPRPGAAAVDLEAFGGHWHYEIRPEKGRLHVEVGLGQRGNKPGSECLVLTLTARGPVAKDLPLQEAIGQGLNLGHDVIVTFFRDATSSDAHAFWRIER